MREEDNDPGFNKGKLYTPPLQLGGNCIHFTDCYDPGWEVVTTIDWSSGQLFVRPIERAKAGRDIMASESWDMYRCPFFMLIVQTPDSTVDVLLSCNG